MLSTKVKDLKYRHFFYKNEKKIKINKFLLVRFLNNENSLKNKKWNLYYFFKFNKFSKLHLKTKTKIVRRCAITNRNRGNFRPYGFSRFLLRDFIQFGILPGYKKAVW